MKNTNKLIPYFLLGILPTAFMFATHDLLCDYAMNPLCYLKCALPAIIASPILCFDDDDED